MITTMFASAVPSATKPRGNALLHQDRLACLMQKAPVFLASVGAEMGRGTLGVQNNIDFGSPRRVQIETPKSRCKVVTP